MGGCVAWGMFRVWDAAGPHTGLSSAQDSRVLLSNLILRESTSRAVTRMQNRGCPTPHTPAHGNSSKSRSRSKPQNGTLSLPGAAAV